MVKIISSFAKKHELFKALIGVIVINTIKLKFKEIFFIRRRILCILLLYYFFEIKTQNIDCESLNPGNVLLIHLQKVEEANIKYSISVRLISHS